MFFEVPEDEIEWQDEDDQNGDDASDRDLEESTELEGGSGS